MAHTKQAWELAAEKLVDDVRWLLGHREAIVKALGESPDRDEAESRLREIHALVTALEVELVRAATADDRAAVGSLVRLLKKTAAAVGITITTTAAALVTTDVHDALTAVDAQADRVIECVIEADQLVIDRGDGSGSIDLDLDASIGSSVPADVIDAEAAVQAPRVVAGQASGDLGFEAAARGRVGESEEVVPAAAASEVSDASAAADAVTATQGHLELVHGEDVLATAPVVLGESQDGSGGGTDSGDETGEGPGPVSTGTVVFPVSDAQGNTSYANVQLAVTNSEQDADADEPPSS